MSIFPQRMIPVLLPRMYIQSGHSVKKSSVITQKSVTNNNKNNLKL